MRTWVAAPIAKSVLESCINILNIEKRENSIEREYLFTDKQYAVVPNVIGIDVKEATKLLKEFKVEYTGNGKYVSYQSPNAGESIYEGETIRLLLTEK